MLVLLGGGHTHALVLKKWIENPKTRPEGKIMLVSQYTSTPYSGMLSSVFQKRTAETKIMIPIQHLCERADVEFMQDVAIGLNLQAKEVYLGFRVATKYDILSMNCGGYVPKISPRTWRSWLEKLDHNNLPVVIVGAGVGGVETALALRVRHPTRAIQIVEIGAEILPESGTRQRRKVESLLQEKNITVKTNTSPTESPNTFMINCSGVRAPRWMRVSGLETTGNLIAVRPTLQTSDPHVFATGDCAQIVKSTVPRAGVYAVAEAPILTNNLQKAVAGQKNLNRYRPQKKHLVLMPTDTEKALLLRGRWGLGPYPFLLKLKNRIDQKFVDGLGKAAE